MNFLKINKYILKEILSFIENKRKLNIIKYSKKLMSKIDITKLAYQKQLFDSIITPALLENPPILLKNKIFDKETTKKLISEWKKEITGVFKEKNIFYFHETNIPTNIQLLEVNKNNEKDLNKYFPNLIILNLYDLENIEIPCSFLSNLESLSFKNVKNIKFLTKKSNILLNKLKHLYMDNISFGGLSENEDLNINIKNLEYLDLRVKEIDGEDDDDDEDDNIEEQEDSDYLPRKGFIKKEVFKYLIKIFNFKFLSKITTDKSKVIMDLELYDIYRNKFKYPKIFMKKSLQKLSFFNFEISYELNIASVAYEIDRTFDYTYLFSKTKSNKYIFKTIYKFQGGGDDCNFKYIEKENRYCNEFNYNDYYYKNKEITIDGSNFQMFEEDYPLSDLNSIKFNLEHSEESSLDDFLDFFDDFESNNKILETIQLNIIDIKDEMKVIENINKFTELKVFIIYKDCLLENEQLIKLMNNLSLLNSLFLIEISFRHKLNLTQNEENIIYKLFPDISINISKTSPLIKWKNNNIELKLRNNNLNNKIINK